MLVEAVLVAPRIEKERRVLHAERAARLSQDVALVLEARSDAADEAVGHVGRARDLPLREGATFVLEQPAHDACALGRKDARWAARPTEAIGPPVDDDPDAGRDDVRVPAEVEPRDARVVADPAPGVAHEGHHQERHGLSTVAAGSGGHLRGVGRQGTRRRGTEHLDNEGVPGRAHAQVSLASSLDLHVLLGYVQEARQRRGDFRNELHFRGSDGHASLNSTGSPGSEAGGFSEP